MKIRIPSQAAPFSHENGVKSVLFGTDQMIQFFPSRLLFPHFSLLLDLEGPCQNYTVINQIENGKIYVSGHTKSGLFRFSLFVQCKRLLLRLEKDQSGRLRSSLNEQLQQLEENLFLIPTSALFFEKASSEKIFFGSHKKLEMQGIRKREDLREILPLLYSSGDWFAAESGLNMSVDKSVSLLEVLENTVIHGAKEHLRESFLDFYKAGFSGILAPRIFDDEYQGFLLPPLQKGSPFSLLRESKVLIRKLFFQEQGQEIFLLPKLPRELFCGRMLHIFALAGALSIDFEWTKFNLFKVILKAHKKIDFSIHLPKTLKTFRLRKNLHEKGRVLHNGATFTLDVHEKIYLDRFMR